jgi:hypothetical protein
MSIDTVTSEEGANEMIELYASTPFALDATDPRNRFHEHALRDARIAHDYLEGTASPIVAPRPQPGPLARLRLAIARGGPAASSQACTACPA